LKNKTKIINKIVSIMIIMLIVLINFSNTVFAVSSYVQEIKLGIENFPESYKVLLKQLVEETGHTNWKFEAYYTGIEWSELESCENTCLKNTIYKSSSIDPTWLCRCGKMGDTGYYCGSKQIVNYYLDPRNFINEKAIFQFLELSYNSQIHTLDSVKAAVKNSFLNGSVVIDKKTYTYADIILDAAKQSGESPISIVVKIFQEIGRGTKQKDGTYSIPYMASGEGGAYNFFNYGATDGEGNISRGIEYAKNAGWTNPYIAIVNGAKLLSSSYVNLGQNTKYFFKFDVVGNKILKLGEKQTVNKNQLFSHQYMTNIQDPNNQAAMLFENYVNVGLSNEELTFIIPIYDNMPAANKLPTSLTELDGDLHYVSVKATPLSLRAEPSNSSTYLTSMVKDTVVAVLEKNVNGTKFHKIKLGSGMVGYATSEYLTSCTEVIDKPVIKEAVEMKLDEKNKKLTLEPDVKIEHIKENYKGAVIKDKSGNKIEKEKTSIGTGATITVGEKVYTVVKIGDINGDGKVLANDALSILKCSVGSTELKDIYLQAADTDNNGKALANDALLTLKCSVGAEKINIK